MATEQTIRQHQQAYENQPPSGDEPPKKQEVLPSMETLQEASLAVDLARAEIDQAIATAHKFPRRIDVFLRKLEAMALYDEASAARCIYSLPRGGKPIVGPSISFANVLANAWGNCRDFARWTQTNRSDKVVVAEGIFHDLETNRQIGLTAQRRIVDSKGRIYSDDMIIVTAQACTSIAHRNAILQGIPRALWNPVYEQALIIVRGTAQTLGERRDKMIAAFAAFGVEPKKIALALGVRSPDEITLDHMTLLRGMYQALRDEAITPQEMFDPRRMTSGSFEKIENPLGEDDEDEDEDGEAQAVAPEDAGARAAKAPERMAVDPLGGMTTASASKETIVTPATNAEGVTVRATVPSAGDRVAQAEAAVEQAATAAKAERAKVEPKPATATATAKPAEPKKPTTAAEYEAHAIAWIAAATSESEIEDRFKGERKLRNDCGIVEEQRARLIAIKDARVKELRQDQE